MKAEFALWRLGIGLYGGWLSIAMPALAISLGYGALLYVVFNPLRKFGNPEIALHAAATVVIFSFVYMAFALTIVRKQWRTHPLLRLAPGAHRVTAALTWRVASIALITMVPAVLLRALSQVKFGSGAGATISFADVSPQGFVFAGLYLVHVVVLVAITCGPLKVPTRFAPLAIMYGAMPWTSSNWTWMPLVTCTFLVCVTWFRRWWRVDDNTKLSWHKTRVERARQRMQWWMGRLQRRAAKATGGDAARLRIAALLATQPNAFFTTVSVVALILYMVIKPGFMEAIGVTWFMAYVVGTLAAKPAPIPLARVMLLPLGTDRTRMGQIMGAVWMRDSGMRLAVGISIGLVVHTLCWWLEWPAFLSASLFAGDDAITQLLWIPMAHALGLCGIALSAVLLASASPRWLQNASFLSAISIVEVLTFPVVGMAFKWALNEMVPATDGRDSAYITFAIVNGAMLPACAWCFNRALRTQWATANLSAISAAMQAWSARLQKALSTS